VNLEQKVCSFESAKKLRELGVNQESYFIWTHSIKSCNRGEFTNLSIRDDDAIDTDDGKWKNIVYSAFTSDELGGMLKSYIDTVEGIYDLQIRIRYRSWHIFYLHESGKTIHFITNTNEAEARAHLIIKCIENAVSEYVNDRD
jgi:hypothetical protein